MDPQLIRAHQDQRQGGVVTGLLLEGGSSAGGVWGSLRASALGWALLWEWHPALYCWKPSSQFHTRGGAKEASEDKLQLEMMKFQIAGVIFRAAHCGDVQGT